MDEHEYRAQVEARWNPLIENGQAVFVWFGDEAPLLIGDHTGWENGSPIALEPAAPGVWTAALDFPPDTYMEYAFWDGEQRLTDPYNAHLTPDGFGHFNHYFYMPAGAPTALMRPGPGPRGKVSRHAVPCSEFLSGRTRTVWLYQPPTGEAVPLWVVWDGQDYLNRANLVPILDNLIHSQQIRPVALALVRNGGQPYRMMEYNCSEMTLAFLMTQLLPYAREHLNLLDPDANPGAYGVMGASMGGLMALYTGMRAPQVFGHVLSQSGAFAFGDFHPVLTDLVRCLPKQDLRIWMDAGRYEWLLEPNREMRALLEERGYPVGFREFSAGHNYPAWRDDVANGLKYLLG